MRKKEREVRGRGGKCQKGKRQSGLGRAKVIIEEKTFAQTFIKGDLFTHLRVKYKRVIIVKPSGDRHYHHLESEKN